MGETEERYAARLLEGARALGLDFVGPALAAAMGRHFALVVRWNEKVNLTALTDPEAGALLHGLDSLLFVPLLPERGRLVDVGSGAGFPGIPIALARPALEVRLLEPLRKRASFLRVALTELGLGGVAVEEGKLGGPPRRGAGAPGAADVGPGLRPEILVSRATIPPLELVPLGLAALAPDGVLVLTAGAGAPSVLELSRAAQGLGVHEERRELNLPGGERRVLDRLRRIDGG